MPGAKVGAFIRSTVATAANATRLEFTDGGMTVSNGNGQVEFVVQSVANPDNYLSVLAGTGAQAPGIYTLGTGSANLGLFPAAGGNLQITSPTATTAGAGTASALPATPAAYLIITVNNTPYKLPLYNA